MLHIICNPTAGKGGADRLRAAVAEYLDSRHIPHTFHITQRDHESTDIARRLTRNTQGEMDIVAMGGDGTLSEVLNGLEDTSRVRLGLIPCGSGNDFAAVAGIPMDVDGALDIITGGEARYTDYLQCGKVRGINAIGMGIDVEILKRRRRMKLLKGSLSYLVSLIITVITFKSCAFTEAAPEGSTPHSALIACAGNGKRLGGGIVLCPEAVIDDGLLDFVIVDNLKKFQLPGAFAKLMGGKILTHPHTVFRRVREIAVHTDKPMPIQIDGEIYEDIPFNIQVVHNRLRLYRP